MEGRTTATPASQQFWRAVLEYLNTILPPRSEFEKIIPSRLAVPPTLGKIYVRVTLKLLPGYGRLPIHEPDFDPRFDSAATDYCVIYYASAYPHDDMIFPDRHQAFSSTPQYQIGLSRLARMINYVGSLTLDGSSGILGETI